MNQEILKVKNLSVKFNHLRVINNLSFSVNKKDVLIILGPNGAGKSTLLKALMNLIKYTGTINWKTSKIGYIPSQELITRKDLPPLTVYDFFKFKNINNNKIKTILNDVGLSNKILKKQLVHLSTGQFQRVTIAWALVDNPDVLILDEPTAGIDVEGEETIYSMLHKFWKQKKLTILLVTHDLNIVWEHASKVLCLNKKVICMGEPEEILTIKNLEKLYGTKVKFYKHRHKHD